MTQRTWETTGEHRHYWVSVDGQQVEFGEESTRSPHHGGGVKTVSLQAFLDSEYDQRTVRGNLGQAVLHEVLTEVQARLGR